MKILIVITALAAVAIAAPSVRTDGVGDFKHTRDGALDLIKRNKKSTQDIFTLLPANPLSSHATELSPLARTFHKKPIIVKKKIGYHVYRDSSEERSDVDSRESCKNQVKVKLCDDKKINHDAIIRTSPSESSAAQLSEDEMKQSIMMAKEAVENLQRDLQKNEDRLSMRSPQWKARQVEDESEMREDIELARQALEHIHKNFGNLESMSLHSTAAKNAESIQDAQTSLEKTEEQRLAQWKEAIENIEKNVEIARNIEDSFKSADQEQESNIPGEQVELETHTTEQEDNNRHAGHIDFKKEIKNEHIDKFEEFGKTPKHHHRLEKSSENSLLKDLSNDNDMGTSASTISEAKATNDEQNLRSNEEILHNNQLVGSNTEEPRNVLDTSSQIVENEPVEMRNIVNTVNEQMKNVLNEEQIPNDFETKNIPELEEHQRETEEHIPISVINKLTDEQKEKSAEIEEETNKFTLNPEVDFKQDLVPSSALVQMKSVELIDPAKLKPEQTHLNEKHAENENIGEAHMLEKNANTENFEEPQLSGNPADSEPFDEQHMFVKSATDIGPHNQDIPMTNAHQFAPNSPLKSDMTNFPQHSEMRWAFDNKNHLDKPAMRSSNGIETDFLNDYLDPVTSGITKVSHHVDSAVSDLFKHKHRFQDSPMSHAKSSDMMGSATHNYQMREPAGNLGEQNAIHWRPMQDSSRSAFGPGVVAPAISSGSAIGVFPNANVGNCGIPLLLSCSPSVVSGSLAKQHPSYPAAAYRSKDEFNFHNKREAKTVRDILTTKKQRQPTSLTQNAATILSTKY